MCFIFFSEDELCQECLDSMTAAADFMNKDDIVSGITTMVQVFFSITYVKRNMYLIDIGSLKSVLWEYDDRKCL